MLEMHAGNAGVPPKGSIMSTATKPSVPFVSLTADDIASRAAAADPARVFRPVKRLVRGYAALSVGTLVAIALLRNHTGVVNSAVWTRGVIVVLSSLLMLRFTTRAARGAGRSYLRLRIVSAVMVVAIVVIVALPGTFPVWMKVEQSACGVLLIGVVALVNRPSVRRMFASS
jgi:hypothetical protein